MLRPWTMRYTYFAIAIILFFYANEEIRDSELVATGLIIAGGLALLASAVYRDNNPNEKP